MNGGVNYFRFKMCIFIFVHQSLKQFKGVNEMLLSRFSSPGWWHRWHKQIIDRKSWHMRIFSMLTPHGLICFLIQWLALNHHQIKTIVLLINQVPHLAFPISNWLSLAIHTKPQIIVTNILEKLNNSTQSATSLILHLIDIPKWSTHFLYLYMFIL